jgi:hypothetical protein
MNNDPKIIWLASYPKSGNTWFRAFLHALFNDGQVDVSNLAVKQLFSSKSIVEHEMDTSIDDLTASEMEWMKQKSWQNLSDTAEQPFFVKIHDAFTYSKWNMEPVIPITATKMALYLVRNPLDVAVSFSNHQGIPSKQIVKKFLNNPEAALIKKNKSDHQFRQPLQTWSQHVNGWLNQTYFPVHCVRYEDLLSHPVETFSKALKAMGFTWERAALDQAIAASSFENLKKQERDVGFPEKAIADSSFFFRGETERGIRELPQSLINEIYSIHSNTMERLGYSTA